MTTSKLSGFLTALLLVTISSYSYAGNGHPKTVYHIDSKEWLRVLNDTVPDVKKIPDVKTDSGSKMATIKEVAKSKKQAAPIAVPITLNVKPLKVIKPRIIKPIIKIN